MYLHLYINYMHTWFSLLSFLVFWTIYCILFYIVKVYFGHILSCLYSIFLAGTYHRSHDCDMKGKLLRFSQVCTYTTNLCVTTSQVKNCNIPWTHTYHFTLTENMTTYIKHHHQLHVYALTAFWIMDCCSLSKYYIQDSMKGDVGRKYWKLIVKYSILPNISICPNNAILVMF